MRQSLRCAEQHHALQRAAAAPVHSCTGCNQNGHALMLLLEPPGCKAASQRSLLVEPYLLPHLHQQVYWAADATAAARQPGCCSLPSLLAHKVHSLHLLELGTTAISNIARVMQVLLQRLAGQAERTQQLEGQAQQAEAVQLELQAGLEMAGARLCLVLAAWMCAVAGKHKVGSCSATCSALPAAIMCMAAKHIIVGRHCC